MVKCHYCSEQTTWKQCGLGCCETVWVARLHGWWVDKKRYIAVNVWQIAVTNRIWRLGHGAPRNSSADGAWTLCGTRKHDPPQTILRTIGCAAWRTAWNVERKLPGNNASSVMVRGSPATTAGRRQAAGCAAPLERRPRNKVFGIKVPWISTLRKLTMLLFAKLPCRSFTRLLPTYLAQPMSD